MADSKLPLERRVRMRSVCATTRRQATQSRGRPQVASGGLLDPGCGENQPVGAGILPGKSLPGELGGGQVLQGVTPSS
jgi:hypothetical protein